MKTWIGLAVIGLLVLSGCSGGTDTVIASSGGSAGASGGQPVSGGSGGATSGGSGVTGGKTGGGGNAGETGGSSSGGAGNPNTNEGGADHDTSDAQPDQSEGDARADGRAKDARADQAASDGLADQGATDGRPDEDAGHGQADEDAGHGQANEDAGDGGVNGDAAADQATGDGPATCSVPSVVGSTGHSTEGVLTNHPEFHFVKSSGPFEIASIYLRLDRLPTFNSIRLWGDLKNTSTQQQCVPLVTSFTIGQQQVLVIVQGPAYHGFSKVTDVCLEPGAKGVIRGIQNNVSATLLDAPTTVSYAMTGLSLSGETRDLAEPQIVTASVKNTSLGWVLAGTMKAGTADIYNLQVSFYIRDPSGLLYNNAFAFPGNLATIAAFSTFDFETYAVAQEFCEFEIYMSFIDGAQPMVLADKISPDLDARRRTYANRMAELEAASVLATGRR
ncbi:MAG TPA: hypothetical protein VF881_00560 [Polyangiaceae bacterium]